MSSERGPGQAWWETHLNAIIREGTTTKAYASREGLPVSSLYYWRRRLKVKRGTQAPPSAVPSAPLVTPSVTPRFVPVTVQTPAAAGEGAYVLALGAGLRLELPGLPSPQWLAQVSQAFDDSNRVR